MRPALRPPVAARPDISGDRRDSRPLWQRRGRNHDADGQFTLIEAAAACQCATPGFKFRVMFTQNLKRGTGSTGPAGPGGPWDQRLTVMALGIRSWAGPWLGPWRTPGGDAARAAASGADPDIKREPEVRVGHGDWHARAGTKAESPGWLSRVPLASSDSDILHKGGQTGASSEASGW